MVRRERGVRERQRPVYNIEVLVAEWGSDAASTADGEDEAGDTLDELDQTSYQQPAGLLMANMVANHQPMALVGEMLREAAQDIGSFSPIPTTSPGASVAEPDDIALLGDDDPFSDMLKDEPMTL